MLSHSDSELDNKDSSYISQKLSLLRDWQFESEVIAPLPNIKWFPCSIITLVFYYISTLTLEMEQEAGLSITLWANVGRVMIFLIFTLYIVCKFASTHGFWNTLGVYTMPMRKEFLALFFIGITNAMGGIFYIISLDFANKAGINHGLLISLAVIASIFVFMLAYRWDNEIPTFMQFLAWIAMMAGVVILTINRPLQNDPNVSHSEIDL